MKPKHRIGVIVVGILLLALLAFIFGNSLQPRSISKQESGAVLDFLAHFGISIQHNVLRKLAHFCEFSVLGFLCMLLWVVWGDRIRLWHITTGFSFGLLCAAADESLQLLNDRSAQLSDVALDFSGVVTGGLVCLLMYAAVYTMTNVKNTKNQK